MRRSAAVLFLLAAGFLIGRLDPGILWPPVLATAGADAGGAAAIGNEQDAPMPTDLAPEELRDIQVFRRSAASVVYIRTMALGRQPFSWDIEEIPQGAGSGFVWDRQGHIVTNYHVIGSGDAFSVTLSDQTSYDARVVGVAPDKDLAVLRIEAPAEKLSPVEVGRSSDLAVGQRVLALGNPFGLDHSLSVGVVSALGREIRSPGGRTIRDAIQTDAAINPGNSGGPLLDSRGRLIGVNSQIYSPSGAFAGIGFAVPVDAVRRLVPQLIRKGRVTQAGIGVSLVPDYYMARAGIKGAAIAEVMSGMPAERAGLEGVHRTGRGTLAFGDIIVAVDGKAVQSTDDLFYAFEGAGVGQTVRLTIDRHREKRDVTVKLVPIEERTR